MRIPRVLTVLLAFLALAWAGSALAASSTMNYQGRLATTTGTPVADGSYTVTFTLWTDSVGGSMLWTESQSVTVSGGEGLFTCQLGKTQPLGGPMVSHGNDNLYLQTAISGQALLPRQMLSRVPSAFSSTSVSTDVAGTGSMQLQVGDDTTKMVSTHESFTNVLDSYVHLTDDRGMLGLKCFGAGQPHPQSCNGMEVDEDEALSLVAVDVDHDGVQDVGTTSSAKIPRAVVKTFFERADKPTESQIMDSVDETGAYSGTIRYHGTDFEGHRVSLMPESAVVSTEVSNPSVSSSSHMRVRLDELENKLQALGLLASSSITQSLTPTTCGVAIKTKGTGADKGRTISSTCDDSSAVHLAEVDDDGDGIAEARGIIVTKGGSGTGTLSASSTVSTDHDEDGDPESLTETSSRDEYAQVRGFKVDIAGARSRFGSVSDSAGSVSYIDRDSDDDGVAEFSSGGSVDDTSSQWSVTKVADVPGNHRDGWNVICVDGKTRTELKNEFQNGDIPNQEDFVDSRGAFSRAINTKGTGATVRVAMEATDSGATVVESDSDGDGIAEARGIVTTKPTSGTAGGISKGRFTSDPDEDGEDECLAEAGVSDKFAQVRGFQVEITGSRRSSFGSYSDSTGSSTSIDRDSDGDGQADFSAGGLVDDTAAQWSVTSPADVPGNHRDGWNVLHVDGHTGFGMVQRFQNGDTPTLDQAVDSHGSTYRAINTTGTGATVRLAMDATDSASGEYATDSDGDGTMESRANIAAVLNGNVVIECLKDADDDGTADVSAETEVSDDSATFRLVAMPPGLPASSAITMGAGSSGVHMEVGAATCDGTNWTNASDFNLKENFKAVDGEVLLQKISGLPITQWNYKGDRQNEHIGPTAQDFKATFGVGSDGKSISTIDPSGVALAAIQQLIKENEELRIRIAKLEQAQSEDRAR